MKSRDKYQLFGQPDALGRPIATLVVTVGDGIHGGLLIGNLLVDSPYRRQGYASKLLKRVRDWASEEYQGKSLFAVTHPNNIAASQLFEKEGYTQMVLWEKKLPNA